MGQRSALWTRREEGEEGLRAELPRCPPGRLIFRAEVFTHPSAPGAAVISRRFVPLPLGLFISGSRRPLPRLMCTGPGFQSDGARAELSPGTSQWHCPLRMINEPADSSDAASCSGAWPGWGRRCSHQAQAPRHCPQGTHLPQCQTGGWHPPTPGRNRREREMALGRPRCSPAPSTLRLRETWKGRLSRSLSWDSVYLGSSRPWPWEIRSSAHDPVGWKFLLWPRLNQTQAFAALSPRRPHEWHPLSPSGRRGNVWSGRQCGQGFVGYWRKWDRNKS